MGNNRQVILKIFRLDNNIYNELASEIANFQIAIAIYVSGFLFSGLAALSFLRNSLDYVEQNLALILETIPNQTFTELNLLLSELQNIFDSQQLFGLLTNYLISSFLSGSIGVGIIYLLLTRFFRKETNFRQVGIIYGFSNIPVFLNGIIFFTNSIPLQIFLIIGTAIFALVCLGSGLKQVYILRNIEAFLLVVVSGFGSSLFSQVI
ncbi:YIP1 family protein [Acidimicrobiaceae bacterium]|nr:YIP1 family protein [Acidimicrobiaceae bacterium]MDC2999327.1 YIP1 family protein [Acidimicrobiaceae bacterium]